MNPIRNVRTCVLPCLLLLHGAAAAAPATAADRGAASDDTIDGIIVNQTVTVAGQEFHAAFAALWSDKPSLPNYAIAVRERPSASRGTTVEVEHGNQTIFRAVLPPARSQVRALAGQAVELVYEDAMNAQVQRLMRPDDDLAPDEF
jgi:curli production assembly/transport component CsgE